MSTSLSSYAIAFAAMIECAGPDHVRQAQGWCYPDQRIDFIDEVMARYWNKPEISSLAGEKAQPFIAALMDMRAAARRVLEERVEGPYQVHAREVLAREPEEQASAAEHIIRRYYKGHDLLRYIPDKLEALTKQLRSLPAMQVANASH